jgi:hypothetical protein
MSDNDILGIASAVCWLFFLAGFFLGERSSARIRRGLNAMRKLNGKPPIE